MRDNPLDVTGRLGTDGYRTIDKREPTTPGQKEYVEALDAEAAHDAKPEPQPYNLEAYMLDEHTLMIYGSGGKTGDPAVLIDKESFLHLASELLLMCCDASYDCDLIDLRGIVGRIDNENI